MSYAIWLKQEIPRLSSLRKADDPRGKTKKLASAVSNNPSTQTLPQPRETLASLSRFLNEFIRLYVHLYSYGCVDQTQGLADARQARYHGAMARLSQPLLR